jgi:hypothetical protein
MLAASGSGRMDFVGVHPNVPRPQWGAATGPLLAASNAATT